MKKLSSEELRKEYLDFFKSKGHEVLPSVSLIPDDPQLLFTVAGMVPFKRIFWGLETPKHSRVASSQKCIRTNDIENVGKTPRHQTFFEMLGNFSFGDYFKKEAIEYAWEFLTERLEIPEDRLWVSIYTDDDEAYDIWTKNVGLDPKRIVRMGRENNFWGPVGPSGPCGPDSEIFYDLKIPVKECPDPDECTPLCDCDRFLEVWNLVFTGLYQDEEGNLGELERKNIDTGMGLERILSVLQGVKTNFETDLFMPMIRRSEKLFGMKYGENGKADLSMRVIADHSRAAAFLIADGVFPSNTDRGYVLRRLIRRAVRYGKLLGKDEPFLYRYVADVENIMGTHYPEINARRKFIEETVKTEEERFFKTLDQGLALIEKITENSSTISAEDAFKLYDTYGMPLDITLDIASEKGFTVDADGFSSFMEEQRNRARMSRGTQAFVDNVYESFAGIESKFVGYDRTEAEGTVLKIVKDEGEADSAGAGEKAEVIFDSTPFYAEMGGQIGDRGRCLFDGGRAEILDTYTKEKLHVHMIKVVEGTLVTGTRTTLLIDGGRRNSIARNHTATHLLHAALRTVLGDHVRQAGSLVSPDKLRFDFTHTNGVTMDELRRIEDLVNSKILESIPVYTEVMGLEEAKKTGATALFGEKYSDEVRVVSVEAFSKELCGGTHVANTGEIGTFTILEERAVAAGVRRIEATTGWNVIELLRESRNRLSRISAELETPADAIDEKIRSILKTNEELNRENIRLKRGSVMDLLKKEIEAAKSEGKNRVVIATEGLSQSDLRDLSDIAVGMLENGVAVMMNVDGEKCSFIVKTNGAFKAKEIASKLAKTFGGKGGGRDDMAQGGWNGKVDLAEIKKTLSGVMG